MGYDLTNIRSSLAGGAFLFATLPTASQMQNYAQGVQAYCSDAGQCVWTGTMWQPVSGGGTFIPATLTSAGINAAVANASAAGGGTVLLPPVTINLAGQGPINLLPNVNIQGSGWQTAIQVSTVVAGTILIGDGTFPCFQWNPTDLSAPFATAGQLTGSLLQSPSIQNLAMSTFSYGLKVGAQFNGGCQLGLFNNLYATNCTIAGFWVENYSQSTFFRLFAANNLGHGMIFMQSGTNLNNLGNSQFQKLGSQNNLQNGCGRGYLWGARGYGTTGSQANNISIYDLGGSSSATTSTQAATMFAPIAATLTATNPSIAATNSFSAGDIVTFSATVGNITTNTNYYVSSTGLSGAAFQVSLTSGGAVVTPNTNGSPNVNVCRINITDLSKVGYGMPIHFSASVNGFNSVITYFVLAQTGTTGAGGIWVTPSLAGSVAGAGVARAPTGNSAVNALINGWPIVEVGGQDVNSGITYMSIKGNADLEGGNAPGLICQNIQGGDIELGIVHGSGRLSDVVAVQSANNTGTLRFFNQQSGVNYYMDAATLTGAQVYGYAPSTSSVSITGIGVQVAGAGNAGQLNLSGNNLADIIANKNSAYQLQCQNVLSLQHTQQASGATLATAAGNNITYTSGTGTLTLPTLTTNNVGWEYRINNPGAGVLTVNSGASQAITGLGATGTSITVAANSSCWLIAQNNAGTPYWARYA